jgi:LEA14-like dessication related protein
MVVFFVFNPKKGLKLVFPEMSEISLVKATIKNDTAYLSIDMMLENKSIFKLSIDTLSYQLKLADTFLLGEKKALNLRQKPGEVSKVAMPLRIPIKKTMRSIRALQQQDSTFIDIDAYIVYNTIVGRTKIPVNKRVKIKTPVPPQIKVLEVEKGRFKLSDKTIDLVLKMRAINKGENIDLKITKINYQVVLGDKLVTSQGVYQKDILIKPQSDTYFEVPVELKVNKLFRTGLKYLSNEKLDYKVFAKINIEENSFYRSDVPLELTVTGTTKLRNKKSDKKRDRK